MSSVDKTQARSSIEIVFNKETFHPTSLEMTVLIGRKNAQGRTAKGDAAFSDGVEHVAFTYTYNFDTSKPVSFEPIPAKARQLLK
ncbi:MAG: hypothetical protein P8R38_03695 [Planctomycetota bacterium]|nr:hypothetical protein [Planctomycetota bacterium]MDG2083357.1 hypothetical protein [Planctomycetota bacterium]